MIKMLRYYWIAAKGFRLHPWDSPYLQWRFETFLGPQASGMTAAKFFRLTWKYRNGAFSRLGRRAQARTAPALEVIS
jgi:hypothetical protein